MRVVRYAYDLRSTSLSVSAFLLFWAYPIPTACRRTLIDKCALTAKMDVQLKFAVACSAYFSCDSKIHATEQSTSSGHRQNRAITRPVICPRCCWLCNCLPTLRTLKYHCLQSNSSGFSRVWTSVPGPKDLRTPRRPNDLCPAAFP